MSKIALIVMSLVLSVAVCAQSNNQIEPPKKANARATATPPPAGDPFDGASLEMMAGQCVTLDTELGPIEIAMMPENAPQATRNFLNLSVTGALDTTTFSRVVKGFVIQGGNLQTSEKWSEALAKRMSHQLPDEPGLVKHARGIVSMARTEEPNSATTHFFILVAPAPHLDSKFAAFGTVTKGMEVVDAINQAPVEGDKPEKPVKINRAVVSPCKK
ncbi:MAG TPA: peptidylprolyl isomerase [Pyrinomonadaceae bacterium]|nr:peptidylprolyl isomerase [Pyrinomonadaceae bacterium]